MTAQQTALPHQTSTLFLTDGGLETTIIFHHHIDLPEFAAFPLIESDSGQELLNKYFNTYADIAEQFHCNLILESPTWRASKDWGEKLNYSEAQLDSINHKAIALLDKLRKDRQSSNGTLLVSGCIGPREDGYNPTHFMSSEQAKAYHQAQIQSFASTQADLVTAMTITYPEEAIGIAHAAKDAKMPVVLSFTVETDGKLPNGNSIEEAITQVDAATDHYPCYYMINCAHPSHFVNTLGNNETYNRIRGIRANASCLSHAELDEMETLDDGDPLDLGKQYQQLKQRLSHLNVVGGCCGTDQRHIEAIALALNN